MPSHLEILQLRQRHPANNSQIDRLGFVHMFINHTYDLHSFVDEIYFKETGTINLVFLVNIFTKMPLQTSIIESLLQSKHVTSW
jgi:hypothetical protein